MKCPYCNNVDSKVIDTRTMDDNTATKRRRLCEACGRRFTTYERIDTIPLTVIKSNGLRETFDRNKLFNGVMKACNKRPVPATKIETLVDEIESSALNSMKREMESKEIGEMVMDKLKSIDEIAYVRFASVYRQFKDLDSFMDELHKMLKEKNK